MSFGSAVAGTRPAAGSFVDAMRCWRAARRRHGCRSRSSTTSIRPIFRMRSREAISKPGKTLGHRGFASTYGLPHFETLELRMVDVERLILAGILVDGTKCLRLGPRFEGTLVLPDRMRRIEGEVLVLGSLQQMEFDETRHFVELRVAAEPHFLERLFRSLLHPEAVHGNEHLCFSSLTVESIAVIHAALATQACAS